MSMYDAIDAVFADQPVGQHVTTIVTGIQVLGNKRVILTIEQDLPANAEATEDGAIEQAERAFHATFGDRAKHTDANGELTIDLSESITVEIIGEANAEAAATARDEVEAIMLAEQEAALSLNLEDVLRRAVRPEDLN